MSLQSKGLAIQAEYAAKRKRALNRRDEEKIRLTSLEITRMATKHNVWLDTLKRGDVPGWEVVYDRIIANLQASELTINLAAESWFGAENRYETYATTYQKNLADKGGQKVLKTQYKPDNSVGQDANIVSEDADIRLYADEKVTLPEKWKTASRLHPQRRRLQKAMSTTGGKAVDDLSKVDLDGGKVGYAIDNRKFNPNAKQVFAALNYGKRASGSSVHYGYSFISLKSSLKNKAIYFPGDTFAVCAYQNAVDRQCTFETLGAVLAYSGYSLSEAIWKSCYDGIVLGETRDADLLLEAHIFEEVRMDQHVEALYLSRQTKEGSLADDVWQTVRINAREWSRRNNVRLIQMSS